MAAFAEIVLLWLYSLVNSINFLQRIGKPVASQRGGKVYPNRVQYRRFVNRNNGKAGEPSGNWCLGQSTPG